MQNRTRVKAYFAENRARKRFCPAGVSAFGAGPGQEEDQGHDDKQRQRADGGHAAEIDVLQKRE